MKKSSFNLTVMKSQMRNDIQNISTFAKIIQKVNSDCLECLVSIALVLAEVKHRAMGLNMM